ncbi:Cleavage and polyadenylation specificity factor subunit 1 [Perkinsus chesapeaki]|uniref:Cleavage and polyadenylation specificity factor subunit 1 n=1 Tax=Perkinsus chesapeaki TaxID=330153 RepID=A0A7J6L772_PERCH|nr:Cleavage and polyadenylation specificity factor subunit 1 [Perkinsus chesapeaki]
MDIILTPLAVAPQVLSLGTQEGSVLLDLTSSISEVFRTPESALDVGKMGGCYYMVTPLGVRRLPVGSSTAEMVLHFGMPCKQASINEEFVAAVMDDGTLGLFRHIDGSFKDIPTDNIGVPEGSDSSTPPLWASAHVSGGKMSTYLTLVEQETSAVKIYDVSSMPPVLVFDVACIAVAPPLMHPRPKTTNLFLSITDPTSRPIAPPAAPPPIDASSVVAAVQLHWLGDLPVLVVMIRNRPPLIYRSFPCPGRPLQESFSYSFQMVEHKNCGLVAEMNSSTEDTPIWTSSAMVTRFEKLGSYEEEGLLLIPSARAPPLVVVKSRSEEIFVHPVGPTGTVSAAALNTKYNPDGLITVQLASSGDDVEKVDVDLVLYQFSSFQAPAGEDEEASSFEKDKGVNGVVVDGPAMAVDDHDVLMGGVDGDDHEDEERSKKASAVEDRSTLESGIIHFDIARPIPCALIPASGQQETPHLCAGGASAVAVVATRQEWDHQEASGLPEHILELSQEFAAQSGLSTGDFSIEDMIAPTAMAKDECPVVRMRDRYQLRVVSRADMRTVLAQYRMKPDEVILDATFMSDMEGLPDPTSVIAIGSAIQGGEDRSARGGLTLLRITALASKATSSSVVAAAEDGENALDEEEPDVEGGGPGDIDKSGCSILIHLDKRGPVTSVRPWRQHLIISIGFRIFMYKWNAKKDTLEGIAMLDTMGPSITSLCTVKNYILAGDAIRGLQFTRFKHNKQQHTNSISYLAKTHYSQTLPVVAVATSVRDSNLGLIALDAHGNIHISSFSPHFDPIRGTGGDVLLHGRPFFMSSVSTCIVPSPVDMGTVLMPLSDGSIGRLLAVNPSDFTVLSRLFTHLVTMLPSPGALHPGVQREPVAYRQSQALPDEPSPVIDGEVCRKFLFLNRWIQAEIAHQIGVDDLDELCRAVATWTKVSDRI